jgi:hypothetical protein
MYLHQWLIYKIYLETIEAEAFKRLKNLQDLSFHRNDYSFYVYGLSVEEINYNLIELNLINNSIETIETNSFNDSKILINFNLNKYNIRKLKDNVFSKLKSLDYID